MEAENQLEEQLYLEAFNNGYLLAKYEPELAAKLFKRVNTEVPYINAMVAGKSQYQAETKDWIKDLRRGKTPSPGNDLNKGNDEKKLKR